MSTMTSTRGKQTVTKETEPPISEDGLLDAVLAATCDKMDNLASIYGKAVRECSAPLRRAMLMADGIDRLRKALDNGTVRQKILALADTPLGFLTDRRDKPQKYDWEIVRDAVIVGLMSGVYPVGNEINIIAGRCYVTKEGYERLLREDPDFTDFNPRPGVPTSHNGQTVVRFAASWKYKGIHQELTDGEGKPGRVFAIPVQGNAGPDNIIGKAKRKAYKAIYERIHGSTSTVPDEENDTPLELVPKSATATDQLAAKLEQKVNGANVAPSAASLSGLRSELAEAGIDLDGFLEDNRVASLDLLTQEQVNAARGKLRERSRERRGEAMSDGDQYECCATCGTEYLQRSMHQATASGIFLCERRWRWDQGIEDDDYREDD